MPVPLFESRTQFAPLREVILAEIAGVADSQQFILGAKVEAFERALCDYTGAPHAIGVSSGTDALIAILMALGIGPGDAVVTTPYTFFATAGGISRVGARPVFVDIDPATYNISVPALRECLSTCEHRVRAIMPVHLFGLCCDMAGVKAVAAEHGVPVIEDAAQALGAEFPGGGQAGAMGEFGYYSFFPAKNLGAFGDAGAVLCRDAADARRIDSVRNHGMEPRYFHKIIGGNFRIDALQAAILSIKLTHLDTWIAARRANAAFYREEFARAGLDSITLPTEPYPHTYNQFVIRAPGRNALATHLGSAGIGHAIYYPVPLHLQECFADLAYGKGDFPESEKAALETLAIPIYPELTRDQQREVVGAIADFYR